MSNKKLIEGKYRELINTLNDANKSLSSVQCKNSELKDLQGGLIKSLSDLTHKVKEELEYSMNAIAWDKLVIAFFGETGAGKSTIIETFRILFDQNRAKGEDGLIVGDGSHDFTKDYHEYEMSIDSRPFTLIDVPGIEGNESEFEDKIKNALGKAHCVFYVQGHNKKPDTATAKKIKRYLGDWVNVYSVQNVRGSVSDYDETEEREKLLTDKVLKNEQLIKESFTTILGDVYKGNIPLQALLAMCSKASFSVKRNDLQKNQQKLRAFFGSADEVLRFSQFQTLVNLVKDKSANFTEEIAESNKQKLMSLARRANNEIEQVWNDNGEATESLCKQLKDFRLGVHQIITSGKTAIRSKVSNEIDSQFDSLKSKLFAAIDDHDKDWAEASCERFGGELQKNLTKVINDEMSGLTNKIKLRQKRLRSLNSELKMKVSIPVDNFDVNAESSLDELMENSTDISKMFASGVGMAAVGATIGSIIPGIGTIFGGLVGWVIGIFMGDNRDREADARNKVAIQLSEAKSKVAPKLLDDIEKDCFSKLDKILHDVDTAVKGEIARLNKKDSVRDELKHNLQAYVSQIKIAGYGEI